MSWYIGPVSVIWIYCFFFLPSVIFIVSEKTDWWKKLRSFIEACKLASEIMLFKTDLQKFFVFKKLIRRNPVQESFRWRFVWHQIQANWLQTRNFIFNHILSAKFFEHTRTDQFKSWLGGRKQKLLFKVQWYPVNAVKVLAYWHQRHQRWRFIIQTKSLKKTLFSN